jgi:hypothetical protein
VTFEMVASRQRRKHESRISSIVESRYQATLSEDKRRYVWNSDLLSVQISENGTVICSYEL